MFSKGFPQMSKSDYLSYALSKWQVDSYLDDGFIEQVPILSQDQVSVLSKDYNYFIASHSDKDVQSLFHEYHSNETHDPDNVLFHCLGHWRITEAFHDLIFHPKVTIPVAQLLYATYCRDTSNNNNNNNNSFINPQIRIRFWHDQLFGKPSKHGANVAWHQDYSYWTRTKPLQHITCHITLDEANSENGAICYIKGSHKWRYHKSTSKSDDEPLPITDLHFIDMESILQVLDDKQKEEYKNNRNICNLASGEASFHDGLTVHGSYPNTSEKRRRACVLNYFIDGTVTDTDESLLLGSDPVPKGDVIDTKFHPVVWDSDWVAPE